MRSTAAPADPAIPPSPSHRPRSSALARATVLGLAVAVASAGAPDAGVAQAPGFSTADWKRVETEHFLFLYPEELEGWALPMARRMESVHAAVEGLVGFAPENRVTVLVDDPGNVSNGSMNPGPLLYVWPTPPDPRSLVGENRGWGEILAVHEFAHAAHLTRPSRNPRDRFLWGLLPIPADPIIARTPRWAIEGYATYVEGRLTGSGRPHGVWRPAVLRTWALEGQLPTYGALNGSGRYYGGAMAYLTGSAYLEWLVHREGGEEHVLPDVWRRLTARQKRSFNNAFAGVFGAAPSELYGLFTVDVTERALAVRDAVDAAGGVVEGELFQRLSWTTGDPAASPDGEHLAVVLRSRTRPSRLVVMATTPDTLSTEARERRAEIYAEDPEDVEPVRRRPRPQKALATLTADEGGAYTAPRFTPDGRSILVVRGDVAGNARVRPDLFLWEWESGRLRRVTRGAAVREADPAPDGTWAAGLRCLHGRCDIVRIDLATGDVTTLAEADPERPFYRPRVSPDGGTIVASVKDRAGWRLVAMDADGGDRRPIGPDDGADRFDAEFVSGDTLVVVSTRGGIHDLELLLPATGETRPLTRVLGATVAPAPTPDGGVFFLGLHSRGWDLRRIQRDSAAASPGPDLDPGLRPAAPVPDAPGVRFDSATVSQPRGYGVGPRHRTLLPSAALADGALGGGVAVAGTDPIGRLSWLLDAAWGSQRSWRGGGARVLWRGPHAWLHGGAFALDGPLPRDAGEALEAGDLLQDGYRGGSLAVELRRARTGRSHSLRAGGSAGRLADRSRTLVFGDYDMRLNQRRGTLRLRESLALQGQAGRTASLDWSRWSAAVTLSIRTTRRGLDLSGLVAATDAPVGSVETLEVGGLQPPLVDPAVLSQRIAMPALPPGLLRGDVVRIARADLHGRLPLSSFYWAGSADGDDLGWVQVAGVELDRAFRAPPYLRLPGVRVRLGLARMLSEPMEGDWRGWAVLTYTP
jgi:Tol biopolymer transport system component